MDRRLLGEVGIDRGSREQGLAHRVDHPRPISVFGGLVGPAVETEDAYDMRAAARATARQGAVRTVANLRDADRGAPKAGAVGAASDDSILAVAKAADGLVWIGRCAGCRFSVLVAVGFALGRANLPALIIAPIVLSDYQNIKSQLRKNASRLRQLPCCPGVQPLQRVAGRTQRSLG